MKRERMRICALSTEGEFAAEPMATNRRESGESAQLQTVLSCRKPHEDGSENGPMSHGTHSFIFILFFKK